MPSLLAASRFSSASSIINVVLELKPKRSSSHMKMAGSGFLLSLWWVRKRSEGSSCLRLSARAGIVHGDGTGMTRVTHAVANWSRDDVHRELPVPGGIGMQEARVGKGTTCRTPGCDVDV